jgi:hypothetical protein
VVLRDSHISEEMASLTPRALERAAVSDETIELGLVSSKARTSVT